MTQPATPGSPGLDDARARTGRRVAILQPNYIPWKGYFDLINSVDEFVLLEDVQYTRRDWRNRNRIKTGSGTKWLTIPVRSRSRYDQLISETEISDRGWARRHSETLRHAYGSTEHFDGYKRELDRVFEQAAETRLLTEVNRLFITFACDCLGIATPITSSIDYEAQGVKSNRLLRITRQSGGDVYVSGPTAREYLDEALFERHGVAVEWMEYTGYPTYEQIHPPFEHAVTILDMLFHLGSKAPRYMRSFDPPHGETA